MYIYTHKMYIILKVKEIPFTLYQHWFVIEYEKKELIEHILRDSEPLPRNSETFSSSEFQTAGLIVVPCKAYGGTALPPVLLTLQCTPSHALESSIRNSPNLYICTLGEFLDELFLQTFVNALLICKKYFLTTL